MRLLHTSDWHLGITLNDKSRKAEMEAFFEFLIAVIEKNAVDTLVISGDIYDTATPSNEAEKMYFGFLRRLCKSCCKDVVIIAGNHDSMYKLGASEDILKLLNIHVFTSILNIEPLVLEDRAIIVPVAFPREQELLKAISGESIDETQDRRKIAINNLYASLLEKAQSINDKRDVKLPIIGTGHIAVSSANLDGEVDKNLYIGGLGLIDTTAFSDAFSYVALGHIHKAQALNKTGTVRYSGSPIAMTFDEAKYPKSIVLACCEYGKPAEISLIEIPKTRELITLKGTAEEVKQELCSLAAAGKEGWISLQLTNSYGNANIKAEAQQLLEGSKLEVIMVKNIEELKKFEEDEESLAPLTSLNEKYVFEKLLDEQKCPEENRGQLMDLFARVVEQVKTGFTDEN